MRALEATTLRLLMSSLAGAALGCRPGARAAPPADAGMVVTVYVAPPLADRVMGRLQRVAARHQWALSVRTDAAAATEADLIIVDSGGAPVGRVRPGSPRTEQAKQMAEGALP
jgi:hypothetical protein